MQVDRIVATEDSVFQHPPTQTILQVLELPFVWETVLSCDESCLIAVVWACIMQNDSRLSKENICAPRELSLQLYTWDAAPISLSTKTSCPASRVDGVYRKQSTRKRSTSNLNSSGAHSLESFNQNIWVASYAIRDRWNKHVLLF